MSSLPNNALGRRVYNEYRLAGLDLSAVTWQEGGRLAIYYVEYATPPRASRVFYDRKNTCFTNLTVDQIDWEYLLDTRLVHLSGLTVPLSDTLREIVIEAVKRAKARGIPAREVGIIDRIGAGDAMVGGVLHGWLQGDFARGLRYGALTAALALSQWGDQLVTNPDELESPLEADTVDISR